MEGRWAGGLVGQSETAVDFSGWAPSSFPAAYLSTASCYTYYTKRHTKTKTKRHTQRHTHKDKDKDCTSIQGQLLHTVTTFLGFAYLCLLTHCTGVTDLDSNRDRNVLCPLTVVLAQAHCTGTLALALAQGKNGTGHKCHSALHFLTPWRHHIGEACSHCTGILSLTYLSEVQHISEQIQIPLETSNMPISIFLLLVQKMPCDISCEGASPNQSNEESSLILNCENIL